MLHLSHLLSQHKKVGKRPGGDTGDTSEYSVYWGDFGDTSDMTPYTSSGPARCHTWFHITYPEPVIGATYGDPHPLAMPRYGFHRPGNAPGTPQDGPGGPSWVLGGRRWVYGVSGGLGATRSRCRPGPGRVWSSSPGLRCGSGPLRPLELRRSWRRRHWVQGPVSQQGPVQR